MTIKTSKTVQTTSLSEAQLLVLSAASQRRDKGVTCPETMSERAFVRAVNGLVKRGLLATAGDGSGKADGAGHGDGVALTITDAGLNAIGVTPEPEPATEAAAAPQIAKGSGRRRRAPAPQPQPEPAASPTPTGDQARPDHRAAVAPRRRDAGGPDRRHRLAAPHHAGSADRPAPEWPAARSIAGRGGQGGLPDRSGRRDRVIARQGGVMKPGRIGSDIARGRDRASARSRPRGPAGPLAQPDGPDRAGAPAQAPAAAASRLSPAGRRASAISTRPASAISTSSPGQADGRRTESHLPLPGAGQVRPGTLLMREWEGVQHRVMALDEGFAWNGATYRSLSQVARAITGTRWSGPRFFGTAGRSPGGAR